MFVLRRSAPAVLGLFVACVGTNPDWNPPGDVPKNADESGEGDDSEGDDSESTAAHGDSSSTAGDDEDSTTDTSTTEAGSSDGDAPSCEPGRAICDGECTDIATEKKACGSDCIDCTAIYGNDARCRDGVCEPKD